jgi:uncharacterized protein (UPF0332 family)
MSAPGLQSLTKAEESLQGAESEFGQGRYNNTANRCYFACFQAAIAALSQASIRPRGGAAWGHAFVQAAFVGQLINQRRRYPAALRQVLARNLILRHRADYAEDTVTQVQAARALQRTRDFLAAIRQELSS